jgi:hypothetical protein
MIIKYDARGYLFAVDLYLYTFDILQAILLNCIENQLYNIHIVYMRLMA